MPRPKKIFLCPYKNPFCDGQKDGGDMMCARCYDDIMEKEFGVEFATSEEADIKEKDETQA